jgi:hypothetical protein
MRFGINLRGDLAKLDDSEIASKFETLMSERAAMYEAVPRQQGNKWIYQTGWGMPFGRGPFHARIFYRIQGFIYGCSLSRPSLMDLYVIDCELLDIRDEIQRRVRRRAKSTTVSVAP